MAGCVCTSLLFLRRVLHVGTQTWTKQRKQTSKYSLFCHARPLYTLDTTNRSLSTARPSWTVDGALTDAQQDWQDDVSRFAESATVVEWLKKVQHQFQKTAARYVSEHGWTALFK